MATNGNANGNGNISVPLEISPDLLSCPVCKKGFDSPKLLPCLHSFCQNCLQQSLKQSGIANGQAFLCPICRHDCVVPKRGVSALPQNVFLETLQDYLQRKHVPAERFCQGCDSGDPAIRKCVQCDDWLCNRCCVMHAKVKVTRSHDLVTPDDLRSGQHDVLIKNSFDPLICGKHEEPLRLYCTEPSCQTPICTVCKATLGHDGHRAIELDDQAKRDMITIRSLLPNTARSIDSMKRRINNIKQEEKMTSAVKKQMHKEINTRMERVVQKVIRQVGEYAEQLHKEVDRMAKEHKEELSSELEESQYNLQAMHCAHMLAQGILGFGRSEEVVAMGNPVRQRLKDFQSIPETDAPSWRHPRLHPAEDLQTDKVAKMFGELTFEGEVIKSMLVTSFSTKLPDDEKESALSDVTITDENDIIVVDRDNKRVKVFDQEGQLLYASDNQQFKNPNRVTALKPSGNVLVKDDKNLKMLQPDGTVLNNFAEKLKHPVASTQAKSGDILVTDWNTGCVHCFSLAGVQQYAFASMLEAPAYITSNKRGQIIISDWKQNMLRVFDRNGKFMFQYGSEGSGPGRLNHPYGVCTDQYGHILIADNWNNRIHMVSEEGRFLRFLVDKNDGIQWPQALVVDNQGHLVVAELNGTVKIFQYLA